MRNYTKEIKTRYGARKVLNRGLKQVHIGDDVWLYGKQSYVTGKGLHMVIYGPNRKEYHVWGNDVKKLCLSYNEWDNWCYSSWGRDGNSAIQSKVKVYILTNILDEKENWCFDLSKIPDSGKLKVICENGTVKNIEFNGKFLPQELVSKRTTWSDIKIYNMRAHCSQTFINVIGYRK